MPVAPVAPVAPLPVVPIAASAVAVRSLRQPCSWIVLLNLIWNSIRMYVSPYFVGSMCGIQLTYVMF